MLALPNVLVTEAAPFVDHLPGIDRQVLSQMTAESVVPFFRSRPVRRKKFAVETCPDCGGRGHTVVPVSAPGQSARSPRQTICGCIREQFTCE